jgi:hypothetical protein
MNAPWPDPVTVKQLEEAFVQKFQYLPDKDIHAEMKQHGAGSAEQFVLNNMLEDRRRKAEAAAREEFSKKYEQAERHHRNAKRLAWTAAVISIVSAAAAMSSAWFAWHAPQPLVASAPTPSVVVLPSPASAPPPAAAPVANPIEYISCRQSKLDADGVVRMTIRNNNGFPIRNISLRIVFMPASRAVSQPLYQFQWFIPELIQSGEDLEFSAADASPSANVLASHAHDSTDEWIAKPEFISAESLPK